MNTRFRDYITHLSEFEHTVLVQCPQCNCRARSIYLQDKRFWQVVCTHCGYSKTNNGKVKQYGTAIDPIFGLPLWLQTNCCGNVLWAYNAEHLEFLEQYVQAKIRERQGKRGNHHGIAVRLPRWMKLAKHRDSILKDIQYLKDQAKIA